MLDRELGGLMRSAMLAFMIAVALPSPGWAAFQDHTDKTVSETVEDTLPRTVNQDINMFRLQTSTVDLRFKANRSPAYIQVSGSDTRTLNTKAQFETYLRALIAGHPDVPDVDSSGYLYTRYQPQDIGVIRERTKFRQLKHLLNHLYTDATDYLLDR
jgi:hypothetical protein